jgi:hypothetical protein
MTIPCAGEAEAFPEDQFLHGPDGTLVQPYIHTLGMPHWASNGRPVQPGTIPEPWTFAPDLPPLESDSQRQAAFDELLATSRHLPPPELAELVEVAKRLTQKGSP